MARIITIVRTRNEEKRIEMFCKYHDFSDLILVADGGSEDDTVKLSKKFPKVQVRVFDEMIELGGGYRRNPDWKHLNFLFEWAEEEEADWIVYNDCDTNPNYLLQKEARKIMEESPHPFIRAVQIFLWGEDKYFPALSRNGGWWPSLWAWKVDTRLRAFGDPPHFQFGSLLEGRQAMDFNAIPCSDALPPHCQLHASWIDSNAVDKHIKMYRDSGLISGMRHPIDFGGALAKRDEWIRYEE